MRTQKEINLDGLWCTFSYLKDWNYINDLKQNVLNRFKSIKKGFMKNLEILIMYRNAMQKYLAIRCMKWIVEEKESENYL